jgi:hypothetical protein
MPWKAMDSYMGRDLLRNIKSDRARQRIKQARGRDVFSTVSCIVKEYGLGEDFLKLLKKAEHSLFDQRMKATEVKAKKALELPPFSLASEDAYRLVMAVTDKLENPYLQFAHSPEEMLVSARLYKADPSLKSEDLLRHDFETLLLCRRAREELADLEIRLEHVAGHGEEGSQRDFLFERIEQLRAFIANVEATEYQPE